MAQDFVALLNLTEKDTDAIDFEYPSDNDYEYVCQPENITYYPSVLGTTLAVPEWEAAITAITLTFIILLTIVGNILVILSVFTYKPLRIVQNFFIVSLAVADLTVAILVLPLNVAVSILGRWDFGMHLCKIWLTSDILCCTASILNLCAIALDRYWAITDPINYAQQRTFKRVLIMIVGVWLLSGLISSPPLMGWNDWPNATEWTSDTPCALTSQQGYVVYSSLGSFYIPLFIMTIVYVEIFIATKRRLRDRAKASQLNMVKQNVTSNPQAAIISPKDQQAETSHDRDSISSETKHDRPTVEEVPSGKSKEKKRKAKKKQKQDGGVANRKYLTPMLVVEDSITDNHDSPSGSQHGQSGKTGEDGHTTTTNTDSPRSRTQEEASPTPTPVAPQVVVVLPKKSPVYTFIEEKQRISLSKERRAARTLGIIMGVFVFCWLPFFLMYVILPFCSGCCPSEKFKNFITWLGYINSALNPIIYTIFNLDFRRAFKKLLHLKP